MNNQLFRTDNLFINPILESDLENVQSFLAGNSDYYEIVTGSPPGESAAHNLYIAHPESMPYADKLLLGAYNEQGELCGLLDALRNFPSEKVWHIGLFIVHLPFRNRGTGKSVIHAFKQWVSAQGAVEIQLSVHEKNEKVLGFWNKLGFEVKDSYIPEIFNKDGATFYRMVHKLPV